MSDELGPPRRPTLRDVADRAGVSKSLASLVMRGEPMVREEKRLRVQHAAEELGYRPRQPDLASPATRSAIVPILVADLRDPLLVEVVDHAVVLLRDTGLEPVVMVPETSGNGLGVVEVHPRLASGLLVVGSVRDLSAALRVMPDLPIVVAAGDANRLPVDVARGDDQLGMRLMVDYLVTLGHQRIAHVGGVGGGVAHDRADGYLAAMRYHGLDGEIMLAESSGNEDAGYRSTAQLLRGHHRVSAITAVNDMAATGALAAIADSGLVVPRDIAVAGYDDTYLAAIPPSFLDVGRSGQSRHRCARRPAPCGPDRGLSSAAAGASTAAEAGASLQLRPPSRYGTRWMTTSNSTERRSSVVERIAAILTAFLTGDRHTMTELARITGLLVSTTHRLVCDLMAAGILDRDSDGCFRIGLPVRQLGSDTAPWPTLRHHGSRLLADLAGATRRRARLGVLKGTVVECIEHCPSADGRAGFDGAALLPAHATTIGKALLAFAPRDRVAQVAQRLNTYTTATIDTPHKLHRALLAIRSTRIAVSRSELRVGLSAMATPVFGPGGGPVAAVELELRDEARDLEVCQPALRIAAASLSRELSVSPSGHPLSVNLG